VGMNPGAQTGVMSNLLTHSALCQKGLDVKKMRPEPNPFTTTLLCMLGIHSVAR